MNTVVSTRPLRSAAGTVAPPDFERDFCCSSWTNQQRMPPEQSQVTICSLKPLDSSQRPSRVKARRYSGHSLRHLIPTVARILGFSIEERNELARWAAAADRPSQRNAMSNVYASEAECDKVLGILKCLVARMHEVVQLMGGPTHLPATGGWSQFAVYASRGTDVAAVVTVDGPRLSTDAMASCRSTR
jgi:hypothetical protein